MPFNCRINFSSQAGSWDVANEFLKPKSYATWPQAAFAIMVLILNVAEESFHPHLIAVNNAIILSFSEAYFLLWINITSSPFLKSLGVLVKLSLRAKLTSAYILTCTSNISVIETIEQDESEELIEADEPVEIFERDYLLDNMEATEVAEEIEIESKSPKVSEEREDTEDTETQYFLTSLCLR